MKPSRPQISVSRRRFIGQLSAAAAMIVVPRGMRGADTPPPAKKLGVALVGLGSYSTNELGPALRLTEHCQLTGAVTGSREKGESWAREYGFPAKNIFNYDTIGRIAGNPDIDVIYVVTPNGLHAEHVIAAAKTGKHIITEKPMANTVAECDAMIAACRDAGVRLMVGYRLHYEPHTVDFCRLARERTFGPFMKIGSDNGFSIDPDARPSNMWRLDKKLAGGGPLMDVGIYSLNASRYLTGEEPGDIKANSSIIDHDGRFDEVEENDSWTMEFPSGIVASCNTTYGANGANYFKVHGSKGTMQMDPAFNYDGMHLTAQLDGQTIDEPEAEHDPRDFTRQADYFADCVWSNREPKTDGEEGLRDTMLMSQIYQSAGLRGL
jgi:predicted dehydrogenase